MRHIAISWRWVGGREPFPDGCWGGVILPWFNVILTVISTDENGLYVGISMNGLILRWQRMFKGVFFLAK